MLHGTLGVAAATALFGPAALAERRGPGARTRRIASRSTSSRPASTRPIMSPRATRPTSCIRWGDPLFPDLAALRSAQADRRRAGASASATTTTTSPSSRSIGSGHARPAVRQPRVRQPGGDVSGRRRPPGPQRLRQDHAEPTSTSRWPRTASASSRSRSTDGKWRPVLDSPLQPPHHRLTPR